MANDTNPRARTEVDWTGTVLQVALLPPLVPVLVFIVATTVSGFQSQGGTAYMPLLSEVWSLALGGFWWALPNLALTPVTLLLRHHAPSVVVGLSYAALVAVVATALVVHLGWLGDPYEWNGRVGALVTAPLFVMPLLAFCVAMRASPVRGRSLVWLVGSNAPARHLSTAAYLLWLGIGVGLAWWSLADIHQTARHYYWRHQVDLAEDQDGVPVLRNPLLTWVDEPPTSASTQNRAWQMGAAATSYRIEVRWWIVLAWVGVPVLLYLLFGLGGRGRTRSPVARR